MPGDPIPSSFPTMGAFFQKPYMEIEYQGQLYRLEKLVGGHNGVVAAACKATPPRFDPEKGRWVVDVQNNIIDIDLRNQPNAIRPLDFPGHLQSLRIISNPRRSWASKGLLVSETTDPQSAPHFPVDSEFQMHIRVTVPGSGTAINVKPFRLLARGVMAWPPPVGTEYENLDDVELFPEWVPLSHRVMKPVARIRRGDKAVLTEVFVKPDLPGPPGSWLARLINRLT